jgi:hypothetical protein
MSKADLLGLSRHALRIIHPMKTGEVHDPLGTPHLDASLKQQRGNSGVYTG